MKARTFALVLAGAACLASCRKEPFEASVPPSHGRYLGVGIYHPDAQWTRLVMDPANRDDATARLADDQAIVVVVDSQTGEIRSCGDLTGYCIGMNPWTKPLATTQGAPVALTRHVREDTSTADSGAGADSGSEADPGAASQSGSPASSDR